MRIGKKLIWQQWLLAGILVVTAMLMFWALGKEGYSNQYYAAAVKSMMQDPSAFFFGSFDAGLFVTVDKPPLGLWLQVLSVKVFGFNTFGLILPSALAACFCVLLVYSIVKKGWGPTAGVIAAAITAATPILIALGRTNNLDVILLFFLLCGAKCVLEASRRQSLPLYLLAMVFVGLGFNVKMLQAFLVLPAFVAAYFFGKGRLARKLLHTGAALCVLLAVSFSWAIAVDSIPSSGRPYIGSSSDNSVIGLALGYNGLNRLTGQQGGADGGTLQNIAVPYGSDDANRPPGTPPVFIGGAYAGGPGSMPDRGGAYAGSPGNMPDSGGADAGSPGNMQDGGRAGAGGPGGAEESGVPGLLRLYSTQLAGLGSWFLLPAAGMAAATVAAGVYWFRKRKTLYLTDERRERFTQAVFWAAWLVPMAVFFSIGGFVHRYYVVMLCPAVGALAAAAAALVFKSRRRKWLVPLCFTATLAAQCVIVLRTDWWWLAAPMLIAGIAAALLFGSGKKALQKTSAFCMAAALFLAPLAWSCTPAFQTINATIPDAGPGGGDGQSAGTGVRSGGAGTGQTAGDSLLNEYLVSHYDGERWAIAVQSANEAAAIILETGLPVMAMGGFSGSDPILTLDTFRDHVASGGLRYVLISGMGAGTGEVARWVLQHAATVDLGNGVVLYDCANLAD